MKFIMSLLVLPLDISALGRIIYFGAKREVSWFEAATLIIIELNSIFMWLCNLYDWFYNVNPFSHRSEFIYTTLLEAQFIAPVTTFLYAWRFLYPIENELRGRAKTWCKWFRLISGFIMPLVTWGLFVAIIITLANYEWLLETQKFK
jgi:hypothetical protein